MFTVKDTLAAAVRVHHLDEPGRKPDLIPIGLPFIDSELGGLGPAACGILAASTNVGKTSLMLTAALHTRVKTGLVSIEDTADVIGSRVFAALSHVDSFKIRKNELSPQERKVVLAVQERQEEYGHIALQFPTSQPTPIILSKIEELAEEGCKLIWLDYIQEVRGHHADRRNEVAQALQLCHGAAAKHGAAFMAISQFHRLDPTKMPGIHNLAESGDLERKARLILLAHKIPREDPKARDRVHIRVGKSSYGAERVFAQYERDESGTLREVPRGDYVPPYQRPAQLRAAESTEDW